MGAPQRSFLSFTGSGVPVQFKAQRAHVGIWYILGVQGGFHIPTLRPKYIPYSYMDPLGRVLVSELATHPLAGGSRMQGFRV